MKRFDLIPVWTFLLLLPVIVPAQYVYLKKAEDPLWRRFTPFNIKSDSIPNAVSIGYQPHMGRCMFKNGRSAQGEFLFVDMGLEYDENDQDKVFHSLEPDGFILTEIQSNTQSVHTFNEVKYIVVAGRDSKSLIPFDSTLFMYSNDFTKLLRMSFFNKIQLYDECLAVDELDNGNFFFWKKITVTSISSNPMSHVPAVSQYSLRIREAKPVMEWVDDEALDELRSLGPIYLLSGEKMIRIKKWKDIPKEFPIDPYILDIRERLYKNSPEDISFGIRFSNSPEKLQFVPFFDSICIYSVTGDIKSGLGYIQPAFYSGIKSGGLVHFFNGSTFSLLDPGEIDSLFFNGKWFLPIWDKFYYNYMIGTPWSYQNKNYLVVPEGFDQSSFFNFSDETGIRVYMQRKNGNWILTSDAKLEEACKAWMDSSTKFP